VYHSEVSLVREQSLASVFFIDDVSGFQKSGNLFEKHGIHVELYSDDEHFLASDHPDRTGCLLIDAASGAKDQACLSLLQNLRSAAHRMTTIMVVDRNDISLAARAIRTGAYDVLENTVDHIQLLSRVQQALGALKSFSPIPEMARSFGRKIDKEAAHAAWTTLTARQREILDRIVLGQPNKIIAADLGISQRTAENHRAAIMKKMGASSISGLIQIALAAS
jgi:two-component system CheB/CheR fusion protein